MDSAVAQLEFEAQTATRPDELRLPDYLVRKQLAVRALGLVLLIIASPVILVLCALIRLTSRGPAVFRQTRAGKDGKPYKIIKLRTMYVDAETLTGPVWCTARDSRVTPLGRALRFLHLDELPQLVNVVRGEMDLIGPRPERPEIIALENLGERVANYADRLRVLPGVTGLAQINLPADQTVDCVHRKVALDLEYIRTASLNLDLRILACTAFRMLGVRHGIAVRFFGLGRPEVKAARPAVSCAFSVPRVDETSPFDDSLGADQFDESASYAAVEATLGEDELEEGDVVAALAHKHPR